MKEEETIKNIEKLKKIINSIDPNLKVFKKTNQKIKEINIKKENENLTSVKK